MCPTILLFFTFLRFYAAVGDTETALQILNERYTDEAKAALSHLQNREWIRAIATIGLALVRKGELDMVPSTLERAQLDPLILHDDSFCLRRVYLAHALATNDRAKVLSIFEKFSAFNRSLLACHFGQRERIELLFQCLTPNQVQLERVQAGYPELKEMYEQSEGAEKE